MTGMSERLRQIRASREAAAERQAEVLEAEKAREAVEAEQARRREQEERNQIRNRRRSALEKSGVLKALQDLKVNELRHVKKSDIVVDLDRGYVSLVWGTEYKVENNQVLPSQQPPPRTNGPIIQDYSSLDITVYKDGSIFVGYHSSDEYRYDHERRGVPYFKLDRGEKVQSLTFTEKQWALNPEPLLDVVAEQFLEPRRHRPGSVTAYSPKEDPGCCS